MPMAAAISGGLAAAGGIGSALIGSSASKSAAGAQVQLGEDALNTQTGMWNTALSKISPVIDLGTNAASGALSTLQKLLTPGASMTDTLSQIPGFKFAQDWGQKAVQNTGTTLGLGGNTLTAGANFATGLAQQGYASIVDKLNTLFSSGGAIASSAAGALGGTSANFANTIGGTLGKIGNATASGILGQANALSGGISGATGGISNALLLSRLFGGGTSGIYSGGPTTAGAGAPGAG